MRNPYLVTSKHYIKLLRFTRSLDYSVMFQILLLTLDYKEHEDMSAWGADFFANILEISRDKGTQMSRQG